MLLSNKTALIYGAGGAVGGAIAQAFAREGARVVAAGRSQPPLDAVAERIRRQGGSAVVSPVDALDPAAVAEQLDRTQRELGPIRLMVNAISWNDRQGAPLAAMAEADFLEPVTTALRTWFVTGTAAARHMAQHGGGTILGVTANAAREAYPTVGGFGVACAAVEHFLRQLAVENGPAGVRVCFVRSAGSPDAPGLHDVFAQQARDSGASLEDLLRDAGQGSPLRHLPSLAEVADAAVLLASDYARAMTATLANVTCGAQVD